MKRCWRLFLFCWIQGLTTTHAWLSYAKLPTRTLRMSTSTEDWTPLNPQALVAAPCLIEQTLCSPNEEGQPQLAKDVDYAKAVLEAWNEQEEDDWQAELRPVSYHNDILHGYWIRQNEPSDARQPVVLFFHTGAGPHDLFLLWKATALVQQVQCQVLICDVLGDASGWTWDSDRSRYNGVRDQLLQANGSKRPLLEERIQAALDLVRSDRKVDASRMAAMGWCLGGHSILELARMGGVRALATFHGVFDSKLPVEKREEAGDWAEVLICNGVEDPFVSDDSLEAALEILQSYGHRTSLLQLKGAKHGFTNPAQDFNENPAFAFHAESAEKAWRQAVALLQRTLA